MALEHGDPLLNCHVYLVAYRNKAFRQMVVVAHHEPDRDHEVVDVVEDERMLAAIDLLTLEEMNGMISPVSQGVEVVRGVIAVVVTVPIALELKSQTQKDVLGCLIITGTSIRVMLDR